jgi:lauroyl/myristoyl acyltransferase
MRVRHAAEVLILRAMIAHVRRGTVEAARQRIRRLARLSRRVLRREWQWARKNLQLVFGPSLSADEVDRLATIAFEEHFTSYLEAVRPRDDIAVRIDGWERFQKARAEGRGTILCAVHLGCWEAAIAHLSDLGLPMAAIYKPARNPLSEREFMNARRFHGVEWIDAAKPRAVIRALEEDKVLVVMTDLNTPGGVSAGFLGLEAFCPPGPARLAARYGVPVVAGVTIREGPGQALLWCTEPLEPPSAGDGDGGIGGFTRRLNAAFEPWIIEYAEQYNWLHPRWRNRPDGTAWSTRTPLETMWAERTEPFPPLSERVRRLIGRPAGKAAPASTSDAVSA